MLVYAAQAKRILDDYGDQGVPGFEKVPYKLETTDRDGVVELTVAGHASPEAFANAAGIVEASPAPLEVKNVQAPQIIGLPNVGQYVVADLGVWEEPEPSDLPSPATISRPNTSFRWLYDKNENDPVVIPEGDPHDRQDLLVPALALGRTIFLRVTRGATTVYSDGFGPIEGGLTEYTFKGQPVPDRDIVSADPGARNLDGSSQSPKAPKKGAQTPSTGTPGPAKTVTPVEASDPEKQIGEKESQRLAESGANVKEPEPAADRVNL